MRIFEFDTLKEIIDTMRKNKLRSVLTGFAVAWGIFMLMLLLGSGQGLKNGITANFEQRATNMVNVWPRRSSMPYKGLKAFRRLRFDNTDIQWMRQQHPEIEYISGYIGQSQSVSYNQESGNYNIEGVMPDYQYINNVVIHANEGRFINQMDEMQRRKIVVISDQVANTLFKEQNPIGHWVQIGSIPFQVVGVDRKASTGDQGRCYIPHNTAQLMYNRGLRTDEVYLTVVGLHTIKDNEAFEDRLRAGLNRKHRVHPDDKSAFGVWNQAASYVQTMSIFHTIDLFVLFIGICTLIGGMAGIGNIMVITVKERTREFGIRKALGATPATILTSILLESVVITTVFGYLGMLLGVGSLELVNSLLGSGSGESRFKVFLNPSVDLNVVLLSTLLLIACGLIAGYIPARKAVRIKPIEAMRAD
ncbi:MAG: ABC transporter permease [Bacteroidales bacterium]|nr:ABC transporter permease [Bacteroidales bacterium]